MNLRKPLVDRGGGREEQSRARDIRAYENRFLLASYSKQKPTLLQATLFPVAPKAPAPVKVQP